MLDTSYGLSEEQQYSIGKEIAFDGGKALVVRIVDQCALFELPNKRWYVDEIYVELLTDQGESKFVSIRRKEYPLSREEGFTLLGPVPIISFGEGPNAKS